MFHQYLQEKKDRITTNLHKYLAEQKTHLIPDNKWGMDTLDRLERFISNGKMLRGMLVYLGYELSEPKQQDPFIDHVALAAEFFQSALLIHDDIMDNDDSRRGKPSMHIQYTELMQQEQSKYPKNTGKSLAICAGDMAFYLGYELLAPSPKMNTLFSQELSKVVIAQMQDIYLGASKRQAKLNDILSMYEYKTGHYSISLPLIAGAKLGNASNETIKHLKKIGADMGIAFQLIDDELDLFGNPMMTGKPLNSDLREEKQTPYIYFLRRKTEVDFSNVETIKKQIKEYGIDIEIQNLIKNHKKLAKETMQRIPMNPTTKTLFDSFVDYLTNRVQ